MSRISVLIPDAEALLGARVARCLRASGQVALHGLSRNKSVSLGYSSLFTAFDCSKESFELESWLNRIDEIAAKRQIDVVMPISDFGIRALGEHRHRLACKGRVVDLPDHRIFDMATNKASLARFLTDHDFPRPPTVLVTVGTQAPETLSALMFPVLAKPPGLFGGNGIQRCEDRKALDAFLAGKPRGEIWVVQELLEGHDVCVNMLCQGGRIIASTVQHAIDQSPRTYWPPNYFEFRSDLAASNLAKRMIEKLSWSGIVNIDMRYDAKRKTTVVLEVNGRYWASLLGSMNAGVNFPLLACEAVSGSIVSNRRPRNIRYFKGARNILRSLTGGGRHGVKPRETDLRYLVGDPVRLAWHLQTRIAEAIRDKWSRQYVTPARSS